MVKLSVQSQSAEVRSFAAPDTTKCSYAMFDRHGGGSVGPYASLNLGYHVGDEKDAVLENRARVKELLAIPYLLSAKQIHDTGIYCLSEPLIEDVEVEGFDALITNLSGVGLMIQQADCQAVLLFDPVHEVIAAVHCGWRGSVQRILLQVIAVMAKNYGTVPADLRAAISPSLGPCCAEFVNYHRELLPEFQQFMVRENYFDFWQITRHQLISGGISEQRIETANICTCCSEDYFSYRRATKMSNGVTGRNCSVIALNKN